MSAQPLPVPPEAPRKTHSRAPAKAPTRGRLALVPTPSRARRAPFVVLLLVLLAGGLVSLLLLNTASAQDSFRLHALQDQDAALQQQQQSLTSLADGLDDPSRLASRAAALGLVAGDPPVFLPRGVPIPKGAIRVGNLIYAPNIVPVTPSPAVPTPTAVKTPVVKKPVVKKPAVNKPVVAGKVPAAKTSVAPKVPAATVTHPPVAKTPVAKTPVTKTPVAKTPVATTPHTATTVPATHTVAGGH